MGYAVEQLGFLKPLLDSTSAKGYHLVWFWMPKESTASGY